jgi:cell wall-associated NlpC family hydrolase
MLLFYTLVNKKHYRISCTDMMRVHYKQAFVGLLLLFVAGCAVLRGKPPAPPPDIRDELIKTAFSLKGKPYEKNGKGPDSFDCSGFVYYVYKKSNISLSPSTDKLKHCGHKVAARDVKPGDLVFFKAKKIFHVGIMFNREEFIHSSTRKGVSVDRLDSPYWKGKTQHFRSML